MINITYVVSEKFSYASTIAGDAGPAYARRHRWSIAPLAQLRDIVPHGPTVIDNRIGEDEMAVVDEHLPSFNRHPIYIKVVDPHWECIRQPYYQWLLTLTRHSNIHFVGPYQPIGLITMLRRLSREDAYVQLPYAYESECELPLDTATRRKFLAVSGAAHPDYYPERAAMLRAIRRHWWRARHVTVLAHPGYPDVGEIAKHAVTGQRYLKFLAEHRFMYLEPSRDGLEFLKYTECAYAGCVPTGRAPSTLPADVRNAILPLESAQLIPDLRRLAAITPDVGEHLALTYRACLSRTRDPDVLNAGLIAHWQAQRARLSASHS